MTKKFFAIATFFAFAVAVQAGTPAKFINVDMTVQETEGAPTSIKLRIPMGLLNAMAPQLEEAINQASTQSEFNLREMWAQIEGAGPMRYADIQSEDANVTIDTTESHLEVTVDAQNEGKFNISVPLALGDVLFAEETVDFDGLVSALSSLEGDLLRISGDKIDGRIWVD